MRRLFAPAHLEAAGDFSKRGFRAGQEGAEAKPGLRQQEVVRRWRPVGESSPPEQPLGTALLCV